MSKLNQLKSQLMAKGLWAKKSLGQNFLIDDGALDQIVEAADISKNDHVIEVGPGTGFLTERLILHAGKVTSVELDSDMVGILEEQFKMAENLEVIHSDILKLRIEEILNASVIPDSDPESAFTEVSEANEKTPDQVRSDIGGGYKVVANIPYYITSPVVKHFLQAEVRPSVMVLLVQKEVAEKICGMTGKSFITIETQVQGKPEYVATIPASSFYPAPKVDSAILKISVYPRPLVSKAELKNFLRIVKFGYSQKRKKLSNGLAAGLHKKPAEVRLLLEKANIPVGARPEELEIEDWKRLVLLVKEIYI